jgi:hypothetical protein
VRSAQRQALSVDRGHYVHYSKQQSNIYAQMYSQNKSEQSTDRRCLIVGSNSFFVKVICDSKNRFKLCSEEYLNLQSSINNY